MAKYLSVLTAHRWRMDTVQHVTSRALYSCNTGCTVLSISMLTTSINNGDNSTLELRHVKTSLRFPFVICSLRLQAKASYNLYFVAKKLRYDLYLPDSRMPRMATSRSAHSQRLESSPECLPVQKNSYKTCRMMALVERQSH